MRFVAKHTSLLVWGVCFGFIVVFLYGPVKHNYASATWKGFAMFYSKIRKPEKEKAFFFSCFLPPFLAPVVVWDWQTTTEVFICGEQLWCHSYIQMILWLPRAHLILSRMFLWCHLQTFVSVCWCVLIACVWICMCFCGGIEMVVIREAGFEWALLIRATHMLIRATLHSSAVETYRIKGLGRNRVTAGGVMFQ